MAQYWALAVGEHAPGADDCLGGGAVEEPDPGEVEAQPTSAPVQNPL